MHRTQSKYDKSQIVFGVNCAKEKPDCLALTGFTEGQLPFTYLGMPITASKLSKVECKTLVDKITVTITTWASRHISYAKIDAGEYSFVWYFQFLAQVFILPQAVVDQVKKPCRNFRWGGEGGYKKASYVAWDSVCQTKNKGGLGIKNLDLWNVACIAKLIWAIAKKNDSLWVQWVHGIYIKGRDW